MSLPFIVIFFLVTHLVRCTSTKYLGSSLSILVKNDLLGSSRTDGKWTSLTHTSTGSKSPSTNFGVIILYPRSRLSAASACAALGAQLRPPELKTSSIQPNLDYLTTEEKLSADQQYCILPPETPQRAIDRHGNIANIIHTLVITSSLHTICTIVKFHTSEYYLVVPSHSSFQQWVNYWVSLVLSQIS